MTVPPFTRIRRCWSRPWLSMRFPKLRILVPFAEHLICLAGTCEMGGPPSSPEPPVNSAPWKFSRSVRVALASIFLSRHAFGIDPLLAQSVVSATVHRTMGRLTADLGTPLRGICEFRASATGRTEDDRRRLFPSDRNITYVLFPRRIEPHPPLGIIY